MRKIRIIAMLAAAASSSAVSFGFLGGRTCASGACVPSTGNWCIDTNGELLANHRFNPGFDIKH